ncbi:hypothetical protein KMW28_22800 [Flammeovirga yaeyamensis]|uniref:SRCR domain-containing protein n=1 Tax=Flammeovirga yaeyamensis TaxID=367791 RepID=A0AAX1NFD6_9BACT|nr:hypothetical protein [Flammeovirga yaeyamensis]MBB3696808.1 hypothetical protein [Flammeovirga yaeyamensis]NMF33473.1 hypothetical protein [Flammeovirga yaeyamensis]QWG05253.1 hypothetical protein KMW28_22800 [Flammeovirga yaeyamensis]
MAKIPKSILPILVFSLSTLLFPLDLIGIRYQCTGTEIFPDFYASPFIYKSTSLATSMAYDYYILGLLGNTLVWGFFFFSIHQLIVHFIGKRKTLIKLYKLVLASLYIFLLIGNILEIQVSIQRIEWSIDIEEEAKLWGNVCEPQWFYQN